jgi:hypothetical protein
MPAVPSCVAMSWYACAAVSVMISRGRIVSARRPKPVCRIDAPLIGTPEELVARKDKSCSVLASGARLLVAESIQGFHLSVRPGVGGGLTADEGECE